RQYQVSRIYGLDVASGTIKPLVSRAGFWANPVVSPDGRSVAFSGNDSTEHTHRTSDLWVMGIDGSGVRDVSKSFDRDPGDLQRPGPVTRLTMVNDDVLANKRLAKVEETWYNSTGGTRVQGWIVKPPSFEASKKYPLILEIHGGPFAMYNVAFSYMFQNFAA